jgi:hypothetical protein
MRHGLGLYLNFCLSCCLILATLPACSEGLQIQVEEDKLLNIRHYLLTQGGCKILWDLKFFQKGKGFGVREEVDCGLPITDQIELRRMLLEKVSQDTQQMQGMHNFVWGSVQNKDVFMPRLAQALRASGRWDAGRGDWRKNEGISAMRDLMNQQKVFAEVVASFAAEGWDLAVVDVEKIQIGTDTVAPAGGKYPVNCSIVFSVKRGRQP